MHPYLGQYLIADRHRRLADDLHGRTRQAEEPLASGWVRRRRLRRSRYA